MPRTGSQGGNLLALSPGPPRYRPAPPSPIFLPMSSLYDADILLWSEQQADLLRRLARGERVNDAVDWENVIEEVGDVGRSEFNSVASLLEVGLTHLDRKSTRLNSSHANISYAVFCLKKK